MLDPYVVGVRLSIFLNQLGMGIFDFASTYAQMADIDNGSTVRQIGPCSVAETDQYRQMALDFAVVGRARDTGGVQGGAPEVAGDGGRRGVRRVHFVQCQISDVSEADSVHNVYASHRLA